MILFTVLVEKQYKQLGSNYSKLEVILAQELYLRLWYSWYLIYHEYLNAYFVTANKISHAYTESIHSTHSSTLALHYAVSTPRDVSAEDISGWVNIISNIMFCQCWRFGDCSVTVTLKQFFSLKQLAVTVCYSLVICYFLLSLH